MKDKKSIYDEYYKITGMWWANMYNMLDSLRESISRKRSLRKLSRIKNWIERLFSDDYVKISYDTKIYLKRNNARALRRLIYDYLLIYDFINAFFYMDLYVKERYVNYKKYQTMKLELNAFLERIKEKLKGREDIVVFWNDCISYDELPWFSKLNDKKKDSLFFEYAYTPTPYTTPSMFAMVNKWMNIDDFSKYDVRNLDYDNSKLMGVVRQYGYEAKYFSGRDRHCVLSKNIQRQNPREFISSCRLCFDAINELISSDNKQFMIIHCVPETHFPFWYPNRDGRGMMPLFAFNSVNFARPNGKKYQQVRNAAQYWDGQLDFYSGMLGDSISKIFMSDHGKYYKQYGYRDWVEARHHIFFLVQSKYVRIGRELRILSLENFSELIDALMKAYQLGKEADFEHVFEKDYIRMQKVDIYSKGLVDIYIKMNYAENAQGYRGIRTKEDCYIRFRNREIYYRNGNEKVNLIDNPEFSDRIEYLRTLAGDFFIDIDKDDKFQYAKRLYE